MAMADITGKDVCADCIISKIEDPEVLDLIEEIVSDANLYGGMPGIRDTTKFILRHICRKRGISSDNYKW